MKKLLLAVLVIAVGLLAYKFVFEKKSDDGGEKQQALTLKKHSDTFNNSVSAAMDAYFEMKNAFVSADTLKVKAANRKFIALLDSINLNELKKDTALIFETAQSNLNDVKANAESLLNQSDITEMRKDFEAVSNMLYPSFFNTINYEGPKMYWQNCPMAFGDDKGASWINEKSQIINPYLGDNHPIYQNTMLHCGSIKDSILAK